ncbi:MAG: hypothetical protein AAF685_10015 [Cyanobacteria bacterium P01_C01_bin.89]
MSQNTPSQNTPQPPQEKPKSSLEKATDQFGHTVGLIYIIAGISGVVGGLDLFFNFLTEGLGLTCLIGAPVYGALGFWVQKKRSSFALGLILGIYIVHCSALLIARVDAYIPGDRRVPVSIIVSGLAGSFLLFEGLGNIKRLKVAERAESLDPSSKADSSP